VTARDRTVLLVVAALAVLAGFWFALLGPKRKDGSAVADQVATARQQLDQARAALVNAEGARKRYAADYATVARLGKAVPVEDDVPSLVYQLETAANRNKIDFRSIKLKAIGTAAASPTPAPSAVASANGSSTTEPAPSAPATSAAAAILPPGATVGPAGFPTMPFQFSFDGGFFDMQRFLRSIEGFTTAEGKAISVRGRLLTVDGFTLSASRKGFPWVKANVRVTAYLLPSDQGLTGGATPAAPAGAGSGGQTASASTAPTTTAAVIAGGTR
jgi:hypothetical protein